MSSSPERMRNLRTVASSDLEDATNDENEHVEEKVCLKQEKNFIKLIFISNF